MRTLLLALLLLPALARAARVDTLAVPSPAMGKTYKAAVVVPASYAKSKAAYPVVYLLHGAYDHFDAWLVKLPNKAVLYDLADQYQCLIVLPEGERFGFYLNSPIDKGSQFETHIIQEVIPRVDASYRTVKDRKGRAITGLSMGGHGALYLSARHPELFCAAGSMSGAVDLTHQSGNTAEYWRGRRGLFHVLPSDSGKPQLYAPYSVLSMTDRLAANQLPLMIDCGVDDYLVEENRELHRRLVYLNVPHDYTERPGAHTWPYWQNALSYHLLFFSKILQR